MEEDIFKDRVKLRKEISRLENCLKKGTHIPNLVKLRIDALKYRYNNPLMYSFREKVSKFLLWLSEKV